MDILGTLSLYLAGGIIGVFIFYLIIKYAIKNALLEYDIEKTKQGNLNKEAHK